MAIDPRLQDVQLLALAAWRLQQRHQAVVVWLGMDGLPENPAEAGRSPSGIYLPRKCATVEEWANSPLIQGMRDRLRAPGGDDHGT